jgi:hypothetical protein
MTTKFKALFALSAVALTGLTADRAHASLRTDDGLLVFTSIASSSNNGFWIQQDAEKFGDPGYTLFAGGAPVFPGVFLKGSIASIPDGQGYWVVTAKGEIHPRGSAPQFGDGKLSSISGFPLYPKYDEVVIAAAALPNGKGFYAVDHKGRVWTAGEAVSYGDVSNPWWKSPDHRPTGIAVTPSGKGYYIVMNDGGVYSFGDAVFHGSTGGNRLPGGAEYTGIALSINGAGNVDGYWLVGSNGGIFTFGQAQFWGNAGNYAPELGPVTGLVSFPQPVTGEQPAQPTQGYAWVHQHGRVASVLRNQ